MSNKKITSRSFAKCKDWHLCLYSRLIKEVDAIVQATAMLHCCWMLQKSMKSPERTI